VYGIPTGGIYATLATLGRCRLFSNLPTVDVTENPHEADLFIDDIIDSGRTRDRWEEEHPGVPFVALVDKTGPDKDMTDWVQFPWERSSGDWGIESNITRIIQFIGDDPTREGLKETPARVAKAFHEIYAGYRIDPVSLLKEFDGEKYDEIILEKNIPFNSTCEHHMLPFSGVAHVAYIPNGPIIGASKMARVVDAFAARLQVQERLTQQVASTLMENIQSVKGAACVIEASHSCMSCRGVRKSGVSLVTSCMLGAFRDKPDARMELLALIGRL
jgi:GTP cyclohydrolase I